MVGGTENRPVWMLAFGLIAIAAGNYSQQSQDNSNLEYVKCSFIDKKGKQFRLVFVFEYVYLLIVYSLFCV